MKAEQTIPAAAAIVACLVPQWIIPILFLALAVVWIAAAWEGRALAIYGASLWLASGAVLIFSEGLANQIALIGFWAIAAGIAAILFRMSFPMKAAGPGKTG